MKERGRGRSFVKMAGGENIINQGFFLYIKSNETLHNALVPFFVVIRRVNAFSTAASTMRRWRKSEANRAHGMKYPPLYDLPLVWKSHQDLLLL